MYESCHFPICILGHVWCLIVSIPDPCLFFTLIILSCLFLVVSYKRMYVHEELCIRLFKLATGKSVVMCTDCPGMTIAVDWGVKQQNKQNKCSLQPCDHMLGKS